MVTAETVIEQRLVPLEQNGKMRGGNGFGTLENTYNGVAPERYIAIELAGELLWQEGHEFRDPDQKIPLFVDGRFNEMRYETYQEQQERRKVAEQRRAQQQIEATIPQPHANQVASTDGDISPEHAEWRAQRAQEDPTRLARVIAQSGGHNKIPAYEPLGLAPSLPDLLIHEVVLTPGTAVDFHPTPQPPEPSVLRLAS